MSFQSLKKLPNNIVELIVILTGLLLIILMTTQVFVRYFQLGELMGIEEILILIGQWFYFCGIAMATRNNAHICGGIDNLLIKKNHTRWYLTLGQEGFVLISNALFCLLSAAYAYDVLLSRRSTMFFEIPLFAVVLAMPMGFFLSFIYSARSFFKIINTK